MTLLFILLILAVFVGGICMWLSGLTVGLRSKGGAAALSTSTEISSARASEARAKSEAETALKQARSEHERVSAMEVAKETAEAEVARVADELVRVEGEMTKAAGELERLAKENDELKRKFEAAKKEKLKPPAPPAPPLPKRPSLAPPPSSDDLDSAQAQLDMERVAHQKTKEELEAVKRLVEMHSSGALPSVGLTGPGARRGAGFKTMSIDTRSQQVTGTEHDRLRQAYDQLQRDKDRVETALARAQQELQLLKMRQ